jgi:hypothetical protein
MKLVDLRELTLQFHLFYTRQWWLLKYFMNEYINIGDYMTTSEGMIQFGWSRQEIMSVEFVCKVTAIFNPFFVSPLLLILQWHAIAHFVGNY